MEKNEKPTAVFPDTVKLFDEFVSEPAKETNRKYGSAQIVGALETALICGNENFFLAHKFLSDNRETAKALFGSEDVPCRDTLGDRVCRLDPGEMGSMARGQASLLIEAMEREGERPGFGPLPPNYKVPDFSVAILDGKILNGSDKPTEGADAMDALNVFDGKTGIWLGSLPVDCKGREKTRAADALEAARLEAGTVVAFDAGITTKKNLRKIKGMKLEFVAAMKGNNGKIQEEAKRLFDSVDGRAAAEEALKAEGIPAKVAPVLGDESKYGVWRDVGVRNGQMEKRRYEIYNSVDFLPGEVREEWPDVMGVGRVVRTVGRWRAVDGKAVMVETSEEVLYLISFECSVMDFAGVARMEWRIEDTGHYVLDWSFLEDRFKAKRWNVQAVMAIIRRMAYNLLAFYRRWRGKRDLRFPQMISHMRSRPALAVQLVLGLFGEVGEAERFIRASARDCARLLVKESLPGLGENGLGQAAKIFVDELANCFGSSG